MAGRSKAGALRPETLSGVRLSQPQLDQLVTRHEYFVDRQFRARRMVLRFTQLHGLSAAGRDLSEAELVAVSLYGANLRGARFRMANLYCSDLRGADASHADFTRADLRGVSFAGARLNRAQMNAADMRSAAMAVSNEAKGLVVVRHPRRRPPDADLRSGMFADGGRFSADFSDASLVGARLEGANLKNADFRGAVLTGAHLAGARLEGARFDSAVLTGVDLTRVQLSGADLGGALFDPRPAVVARADELLEEVERAERWWASGGMEGRSAVLDDKDLRVLGDRFMGRRLTGLSARQALGVGVDFSRALLQSAVFDGADLRGACFDGADLRGASFRGANLHHASFEGAALGPLLVSDSSIRPVDFTGAVGLSLDRAPAAA